MSAMSHAIARAVSKQALGTMNLEVRRDFSRDAVVLEAKAFDMAELADGLDRLAAELQVMARDVRRKMPRVLSW
jgi:hypothetical protein